MLYIVATPIGNRDDITTRALQVLGDADFIMAEDTRHTGQLLAFYGIKKPLISFRDAPKPVMDRTLRAIMRRLKADQTGAYVTDAGTPGISDPGWRLVKAAEAAKIPLTTLPGPSAVTTLLALVDRPLEEYRFVGFLPKKKGNQTKIKELLDYLQSQENRGVILFESPRRIRKTLVSFEGATALVGRELTKKFETIYRGVVTPDFIGQLPEKGEYVVLIHGLV